MSHFSRLTIGTKLSLLVTLASTIALLVLAVLSYRNSAETYETEARHSLATASVVMRDTVALYDRMLTENTERLGGSFASLLPTDTVTVDPGRRILIGDSETPRMAFGPYTANLDFSLVDRFLASTDAIATLFVRDGEDFVRVTTSLTNAAGERAIGTRLDHAHPAYARMLADAPYTGRASLFGSEYMTHYRPLHDADGKVAGILFVGVEYGEGLLALKDRLRQTRIGEDGYFFVVDAGQGESAGTVLAHPSAEEGIEATQLVAADDQAAFSAMLMAGSGDARAAVSGDGRGAAEAADLHVERFEPWQWNLVAVQPRRGADAALAALLLRTALVSLLALVALVALVVFASRRLVSAPLSRAVEIADRVAAGRLDNTIQITSRDESGRLLASMQAMQQQVQAVIAALADMTSRHDAGQISYRIDDSRFPGEFGRMVRDTNALVGQHIAVKMRLVAVMQRYAVGDLSEDMDRYPGEKAVLSNTMDAVKANLGAINREIRRLAEAAAAGDFSQRGDAARFEHDFRAMIDGLNGMIGSADDNLTQVSQLLQAIAGGDLTARMHGDFHGVFAKMRDDANATVEQLTGIVGRIQQSNVAINTAATEIASGNSDLSRRTEQQAANLEETAASMEELTSTVRQNADHARQANQLTIGAASVAAQGGQVVGQVVTTMADIQASSRRIADIISVIDGIAFQTNILALNAAVEAARAGEQGRGFAVVATEVRSLAQRSATAAKEIKGLIEDSTGKVETGSALAQQAGATMGELVASVQRVTDIMAEISAASQEQAAGIEQVNQTITQMDETTQQNAALVEEATAAARSMEEQAAGLATAIAVFRTGAGAGTAARHAGPGWPLARSA
ncbi:Cache 3/Cache 2 fusion domain-containing protein [Xanthomonas sp. XNM01]|uniref:Cache 3/Cache 2 fusion domain-containing protein n=1 Tax=Xanthomonas sp. XNM01 TaxID=2769289 RepID=UPI00177F117D|nr:Cache 3/Cache 2 fusion domain-containing protein [Xanthomonas sp. XNM01]MBD9368261.1 Cache 3/Cache 2 fusion domain-containing protein [Xanthomonas sp. XNM01]